MSKEEHAFRWNILSSACGVGIALAVFGSTVLAQEATPVKPHAMPAAPQAATTPAATATVQTPAPTQQQQQAEMAADAEEFVYDEPLQVGDATQGLFAWQRSGEIASPTARPIAGNIASRSYERYLKSFEFPIPERMSSTVKSTSGSGADAATPR
jgi:hypothetical protein